MAAINPVALKLSDDHKAFLDSIAEKEDRPCATQARVLLIEVFNEMGFESWLRNRESSLPGRK
jgi:predicted transcriptional regulator